MLTHTLRHILMVLFTGVLVFFGAVSQGFAAWELPPHDFGITGQNNSKTVADELGHAFTLIDRSLPQANVYYYNMGAWSASPVFSVADAYLDIDIAMDTTGTALLVWNNGISGFTGYFNGTSWSTILSSPFGALTSISVDMNGPGSGVAAWSDGTNVYSSFFFGAAWGPVTNLGFGDNLKDVAFSTNGSAVATWNNGTAVTVNQYISGSWGTATVLEPNGISTSIGIDANGKALALYEDSVGGVFSGYFNGSTWVFPLEVDATPNSYQSSLSMGENGTAVAVYVDSSTGTGYTATFNGTSWAQEVPFGSDPIASAPSVSVNSTGNALILFTTTTGDTLSIRIPSGGALGPEEFLQSSSFPPNSPSAVLLNNGRGFISWNEPTDVNTHTYATTTIIPVNATNFTGNAVKNKFVTQSDLVNVLCWTPSTSTNIVSYILRRNGVILATISATGPFCYYDHCRCKGSVDVYTLTAVDTDGVESDPLEVTVSL